MRACALRSEPPTSYQVSAERSELMQLAGFPASRILGEDSARAHSLRHVTPYAAALTWVGSFFGIAIGGALLPDVVPNTSQRWLTVLAIVGLLMSAAAIFSLRWESSAKRYQLLRMGVAASLCIFAVTYWLGPVGVPVILIASIGIPLQSSHFLVRRDTLLMLAAWTVLSIAAVVEAIERGLTVEQTVPLAITVIPLTVLLTLICFQLTELRVATVDRMRMLALRDAQTGLANRRGLQAVVEAMISEGRLTGLVLIDLDDFKSANTLYGHPGGDRVISVVARALEREFGADNLVVRFGGDEFVVVCTHGRCGDPALVAERVSVLLAGSATELGMKSFRLTASTGVAGADRYGSELDALLKAAEANLVDAKSSREPSPAPDEREVAAERAQLRKLPPELAPVPLSVAPTPLLQRRLVGGVAATLMLLLSMPLIEISQTDRFLLTLVALAMPVFVAPIELFRRVLPGLALVLIGVLAYPLVAVATALSGGVLGPALPLLLLLAAYDARGDSRLLIRIKFLVSELAALSPLLALGGMVGYQRAITLGIVAAIVVMLPIIFAMMLRSRGQLATANREAREAARHDPLTGVLNRRSFELEAREAINAGERCAIVMVDLDNFKQVNTERGYSAGDRLLADIGEALIAVSRQSRHIDQVARVGGDEFAVLLRDVAEIDLAEAAERFIGAIDELVAERSGAEAGVSASCGIAIHPDHAGDFSGVMAAADRALMRVKRDGKSAARLVAPRSEG